MKLTKLTLIIGALSLLCLAPLQTQAQPGNFGDLSKLPKLGEIRGITSITAVHLAVWYLRIPADPSETHLDVLVIYEVKTGGEFAEVFRVKSEPWDGWDKLVPLPDSSLIGVTIQSGVITNYDAAMVVALVGGKFQIVFQGSTSEFRDLNEDWIPEIFESMWPDGDGYPASTTVHVWNGKTYKRLMKVSYRKRFGPTVQAAVKKAARGVPRPDRQPGLEPIER